MFRVYRLGQKKPCFIYRFIALGTMEEAIYKRQVAKISMSKRVVDEQQIDAHFKRNDLDELYSTKNIEPKYNRSNSTIPDDHILARQLEKFKSIIFYYHCHDSLLQNNEEENLSQEERQLAWNEYKSQEPAGSNSQSSLNFPCLQIGIKITQIIFFQKKFLFFFVFQV